MCGGQEHSDWSDSDSVEVKMYVQAQGEEMIVTLFDM